MGQVLVRNLDDDIIERLKKKAAQEEKSLEQVLREIIAAGAGPSREQDWKEIDEFRAQVGSVGADFVEIIREFRDNDEHYR